MLNKTMKYGIALCVFGFFLGWLQFNHSYEFLVGGLALIAFSLSRSYDLQFPVSRKIFLGWFAMGIASDLYGTVIFHLWAYRYFHWWDYALNALTYPAAGYIMCVFFLLGLKRFGGEPKRKVRLSFKMLSACALAAVLVLPLLLWFKGSVPASAYELLLGFDLFLFVMILLTEISVIQRKRTFVGLVASRAPKSFAIMAVVVLFGAFVQELLGAFARQWAYIVHTGTFLDKTLYYTPFAVYLGWFGLLALPLQIYFALAEKPISA